MAQYPQLIFRDMTEDVASDFFVAYVSRSGHRMTLVRPPRRLGEQLGPRLRAAWPYKIAAQSATEEEIYSIELKRNAFGGCVHLHNCPRLSLTLSLDSTRARQRCLCFSRSTRDKLTWFQTRGNDFTSWSRVLGIRRQARSVGFPSCSNSPETRIA